MNYKWSAVVKIIMDYVFGGHVSCDTFRFWLVIYKLHLVISLTKEIDSNPG